MARRAEQERITKERQEQDRISRAREEKERVEREKQERERAEKEKKYRADQAAAKNGRRIRVKRVLYQAGDNRTLSYRWLTYVEMGHGARSHA